MGILRVVSWVGSSDLRKADLTECLMAEPRADMSADAKACQKVGSLV